MFEKMFERMAATIVKPMLEEEYKRGYSAGVSAERLVKANDQTQREYDLLRRGIEQGRAEILAELDSEVEEISAREFEELTDAEPFGFVGTLDDLSLVLDEEVTA